MANTLKATRYKIELWIDDKGEVEGEAFAYPTLFRPAKGALSPQEEVVVVKFSPSTALKTALKAEQKSVVDTQVAR